MGFPFQGQDPENGGAWDAQLKAYVDDADAALQTQIDGIDGVTLPIAESDVTDLVDDLAAKAPVDAPTFTTSVTLPGAPTADLEAATKKYVDDNAGGGGGDVTSVNTRTGDVTGLAEASDLTTEVSRAEAAEGTNASAISTETSRATAAEALLAPKASPAFTGAPTTAADPTAALGLATKQYVDAVAQGLSIKPSVACATTANLTLLGEQSIDGVTTSASRVLVKNQTAGAGNGIYVSGAGAWTRAADMDAASEVPGAFVFVEAGTTNGASGWVVASQGPFTLGTTTITWTQFSGAGEITAGTGIGKSGNTLSIDTSVTVDKTTAQTLTNKTLTAPVLSSPTGLAAADIPSLDAAKVTTGTFAIARLASGTPTGTKFVSDAGTLLVPTQTTDPTLAILQRQQFK